MAMFTAYFDTSGHPNQQQILTTAGFVSTVDKWVRFDREWNGILKSEGIKVFHMTDFASNEGEFAKGWRGETERRKLFIERLARSLKRNVNKSFRTSLVIAGYNAVNTKYEIEELLGKPYTVCCMRSVLALRNWAARKNASRKLLYFFEDGDKDKGNFEAHHKSEYKIRPEFLDKTEAVAFQAADFVGWKIRTNLEHAILENHTLEKGHSLLRSIELLKSIPKDAGVLTQEASRVFASKLE